MNRIFLLLGLFSAHATAFIDRPVFNPASPIPLGDEINFTVRHGICDAFPVVVPGFETQIEYQGNDVIFTVPGVRALDLALCSFSIEAPPFRLPPMPSGNYELRFRVRDVQRPDRIYVVDPVPFVVTRVPTLRSEAVPGLNPAGIALLVLGLFGMAAVGLRKA